MRPYLEKTHHRKGLMEWLKVPSLSLSPSTTKKQKERGEVNLQIGAGQRTLNHLATFQTHMKVFQLQYLNRKG
jgi:hypothetical protein